MTDLAVDNLTVAKDRDLIMCRFLPSALVPSGGIRDPLHSKEHSVSRDQTHYKHLNEKSRHLAIFSLDPRHTHFVVDPCIPFPACILASNYAEPVP